MSNAFIKAAKEEHAKREVEKKTEKKAAPLDLKLNLNGTEKAKSNGAVETRH